MWGWSMKVVLSVVLLASLFFLSFVNFQIPAARSSEVHDVAVTDVTIFPDGSVFPAMSLTANVTIENQGTSVEAFNVTLYAGNLTIQTMSVDNLAPGSNTTLPFEWMIFPFRILIFPPPWPNPRDIMSRNLPLKAEADVVLGEIDTADNVYINGIINVIWMVPDVNGDGRIDMRDIAVAAKAFGTFPGNPRWNPWVDFNQDGKIDMKDIATSAVIFGATYS